MEFTEEDYKYGSTYTGYNGTPVGCPPALKEGRRVCGEVDEPKYVEVVCKTIKWMKKAMGENRPAVNILFRSPGHENLSCLQALQLETYLMQEYMPDGENHPLYKAATQESFQDFQAGVVAYKESKQ